jgi:hypothetical protein
MPLHRRYRQAGLKLTEQMQSLFAAVNLHRIVNCDEMAGRVIHARLLTSDSLDCDVSHSE